MTSNDSTRNSIGDFRRYKRPESVLVVVYTRGGEVLLLRRRKPPVGIWQSVTGSLRWEESPRDAARRELLEETGLDGRPRPMGAANTFDIVPEARALYARGVTVNTEHVFELRLDRPVPVRLDAAEHADYRWLSAERALESVWSWSNRDAIAAVCRNIT